MDKYEMKEGDFNLFINELSPEDAAKNKPNLTGKVMQNGKEMRIAGWSKESASGKKYISGKISEFMKQDASAAPATQAKDDVPW